MSVLVNPHVHALRSRHVNRLGIGPRPWTIFALVEKTTRLDSNRLDSTVNYISRCLVCYVVFNFFLSQLHFSFNCNHSYVFNDFIVLYLQFVWKVRGQIIFYILPIKIGPLMYSWSYFLNEYGTGFQAKVRKRGICILWCIMANNIRVPINSHGKKLFVY